MKALNGIKLRHRKNTEEISAVYIPLPKKIKLPMSMSMGAPCNPIVKIGDTVKVGQKIGECTSAFGVPVHSSVSGKVTAISEYCTPFSGKCKAIEIETDGKQEISDEIKTPVISDRKSFLDAVCESGVCGLGGAGFPTHIKLSTNKKLDTIIVNAAECEPYITSDYREMLDNTDDVLNGLKMIKDMLGIKNAIIAIEKNKPQAIKKLTELTRNDDSVTIAELPSVYPQGAEKVIIYNTTSRIVEEGKIPADYGIIVMNVSTVSFIYRYSLDGMPFTVRRITVDGNAVGEPKNIFAPIGTPISDILKFCKTDIDKLKAIISGGPMMGVSIPDIEMPIVKTTNALLAFSHFDHRKTSACIRCGRCVAVCPLGLMPAEIEKAYKNNDIYDLKALKVNLCMNCGSCTYICPANRKLAEMNQLVKKMI